MPSPVKELGLTLLGPTLARPEGRRVNVFPCCARSATAPNADDQRTAPDGNASSLGN